MNARKPNEHPLVLRIVVGDVICPGILCDQRIALLKVRANHERIAVFLQPHKKRVAEFERRCPVGRAFLDVFERKRDLANGIERYGHRRLRTSGEMRQSHMEELDGFARFNASLLADA
jgi:hypothetical protein